jgi:hypothetical protein
MAPLISRLEYSTRENVADLSPQQVFERGLPDQVTVTIGWFGSLRDAVTSCTIAKTSKPTTWNSPGRCSWNRRALPIGT